LIAETPGCGSAEISAQKGAVMFDFSFLPPADLEFVVMTDTHYMLDPGPHQIEFESRRRQSARAAYALQLVSAFDAAFVVHLGDLIQEFPESHGFTESLAKALEQLSENGVQLRQVAGNHDVGDKPDPTMPTDWVSAETLTNYHDRFGQSWYSWSAAGCHFVVLNSQIMNGSLPEVHAQERWLEGDLAAHTGMPIFLFLHLSPFLVFDTEQGLGHYDNIDQPARGWLLELVRKHDVQMVFSGHSHFSFFNRLGNTRLRVVPSTAFTRPGFCEVFSSSPPPERGRDDVYKLGFLLVRVIGKRASVHLVRTEGATEIPSASPQRVLTRISQDLPHSPLGVSLRHALATMSEVPIAWQSTIRQPVRNDYPFLACVEAGVRHVRFPSADLLNGQQRERLLALRDEGVALTATWIWSEQSQVMAEAVNNTPGLDFVEVQYPGAVLPEAGCLQAIKDCASEADVPITLSALRPRETAPGKQHARTRIGYHLEELSSLDQHLGEHGVRVDRVLCRVDAGQSPWQTIIGAHNIPVLNQIGAIDWAVEFGEANSPGQVERAVEAMAGVALFPESRLFFEPLMDLDRTMDAPVGLLDRLCNPRPVFHVVRTLNTILHSEGQSWKARSAPACINATSFALHCPDADVLLLVPHDEDAAIDFADLRAFAPNSQEVNIIDLKTGTSWPIVPDADPSMTVQLQGATAMLFAHTSRPDLSKSPRYRLEELLDVTRPQP